MLISSLVKLAYKVKTFLLHYTSFTRKSVIFPQRTTASKFIVELSEIYHRNIHEVEGVSAHDARFDSHEQ